MRRSSDQAYRLTRAARCGGRLRPLLHDPPGQASGKTGDNTRVQIVDWIENQAGKAYTSDRAGHRTEVAVVTPARGEKYLRTHADGVWTNNLLA
jgi:hypothetical protein